MNGGICVSNMLGLAGTTNVEIIGNEVSDNRYGIALYGQMNAVVNDNVLMNNNYESKPMNGGSGVSIYGMGVQNVYMSGNHIEGHYWGITNIKYTADPFLNLGNLTEGDNYNPGGNVFVNNGNGGVLYDLYNNSTADVMAQGNTWNVDVQDEASIEEVIYHKVDNASLGLVTFMPAGQGE
jgi:parallel beta-helix repeat protein